MSSTEMDRLDQKELIPEKKKPEKKKFYKSHTFLIALQYVTLTLVGIAFYNLDIFSAPYFSFGPGPDLQFFNFNINTWEKWIGVVLVRIVLVVQQTMCSSIVHPWIFTVFQNRMIPLRDIGCSLSSAIFNYNAYEISVLFNGIINLFMMFTQLDLALIEGAVYLFIMNIWTIPEWIVQKQLFEDAKKKEDASEDPSVPDVFSRCTHYIEKMKKEFKDRGKPLSKQQIIYIETMFQETAGVILKDFDRGADMIGITSVPSIITHRGPGNNQRPSYIPINQDQ